MKKTEKLWIVFVNDSLGELDWLSPFLKYAAEHKSVDKIMVNYSLPSLTDVAIERVHTRYFGSSNVIKT